MNFGSLSRMHVFSRRKSTKHAISKRTPDFLHTSAHEAKGETHTSHKGKKYLKNGVCAACCRDSMGLFSDKKSNFCQADTAFTLGRSPWKVQLKTKARSRVARLETRGVCKIYEVENRRLSAEVSQAAGWLSRRLLQLQSARVWGV